MGNVETKTQGWIDKVVRDSSRHLEDTRADWNVIPRARKRLSGHPNPDSLGFWREILPPDANEGKIANIAMLVLKVCLRRFLPLAKESDRKKLELYERNFSIKEIAGWLLDETKRESLHFSEEDCKTASILLFFEFAAKRLLLDEKGKPLGIESLRNENQKFHLKLDHLSLVRAYEYTAYLGRIAGVDNSSIEPFDRLGREFRLQIGNSLLDSAGFK